MPLQIFTYFLILLSFTANSATWINQSVSSNVQSSGEDLIGNNICTFEEMQLKEKTIKDMPITMRTDENGRLLDIPKTAIKPIYKVVYENVTVNVSKCCEGYIRDANHCIECSFEYYGLNCKHRCSCSGTDKICDKIIGCCKEGTANCNVREIPIYFRGARTFGFWGVLLFASCGLLFGMVFYYRRKYQKERDPAFPVVTFLPEKVEVHGVEHLGFGGPRDSDIVAEAASGFDSSQGSGDGLILGPSSRNQFHNPLYGDPVAERTLERRREQSVAAKKLGSGHSPPPPYSADDRTNIPVSNAGSGPSNYRPQNEYASLDSMVGDDHNRDDEYTEATSMATSPLPSVNQKVALKKHFIGNNEYDKLFTIDTAETTSKSADHDEDEDQRYEVPISPSRAIDANNSGIGNEQGSQQVTSTSGERTDSKVVENTYV